MTGNQLENAPLFRASIVSTRSGQASGNFTQYRYLTVLRYPSRASRDITRCIEWEFVVVLCYCLRNVTGVVAMTLPARYTAYSRSSVYFFLLLFTWNTISSRDTVAVWGKKYLSGVSKIAKENTGDLNVEIEMERDFSDRLTICVMRCFGAL